MPRFARGSFLTLALVCLGAPSGFSESSNARAVLEKAQDASSASHSLAEKFRQEVQERRAIRMARRESPPKSRRTLSESFRPGPGSKVRVAFFDADSTLRVSLSGSVSANHPTDAMLLPEVAAKLSELNRQGYLVAVVSNQGGVASGYITLETADGALQHTLNLLQDEGAVVHYYDFAENRDHDRKPQIGMAQRLELEVREKLGKSIDWESSFMVGDSAWKRKHDVEPDGTPGSDFSNSDRRFAENIREHYLAESFGFSHPRDYFGWAKKGIRGFRKKAEVEAYLREL